MRISDWSSDVCSSDLPLCHDSAFDVQDAEESEEGSGGVEVDVDLAVQSFFQLLRTLIVNAAPGHIHTFDLLRRCLPDRLIIAVTDGKIIADGAAEAAKPQHHGFKELTVFPRDADSEPSLFHAKGHLIGPFVTVSMFALRREMVF